MALEGPSNSWDNSRIAIDSRFTTLPVAVSADDAITFVRSPGEDVAPRLRALVGE